MRRGLLIGAPLVAVLLGLAAGLAARDGKRRDTKADAVPAAPIQGGPLAYPSATRTHGFFPVDLGRPYSWGEVLLTNEGRLAVTIEDVELIDSSPGLVILDTRIVRPTHGLIGFLPGWKPDGDRPEGVVIAPGREDERELVVGLRIDEPGSYRIDGVRIRYHDALTRYVARFDQVVVLCGPAARYTTKERCRLG